MLMSSAPIALTTKSSIRCTRTPISHHGSTTSCAIGNIPITACALTSPSPTSPHWNSSLVGKTIRERQSVTNLLDEYRNLTSSSQKQETLPQRLLKFTECLLRLERGGVNEAE